MKIQQVLTALAIALIFEGSLSAVPPESELPGVGDPQRRAVPPGESSLPTDSRHNDASKLRHIPSESQLAGDRSGNAAAAENSLPNRQRPWLRLDLKGHTGTIRSIDGQITVTGNSGLAVSGGDDKDLHVWRRTAKTQGRWVHAKTIRWPVVRGPRGRIYSVALAGDVAAFAGHGASGGLGEIWIVKTVGGQLIRSLVRGSATDANLSHRQVIASLAWSPQSPAKLTTAEPNAVGTTDRKLASIDVEGRLLVWQADPLTGLWSAEQYVADDQTTYGTALADALRPRRQFVPVTFLGDDHVVLATYVGAAGKPTGAARWQLQRIHLSSGKSELIEQSDLIEFAVDIKATEDGRTLIASDAMGTVKRFRFDKNGKVIDASSFSADGIALSMDLHPDGHQCAIGVVGNRGNELQIWDLESDQPARLGSIPVADRVASVKLLPRPDSDVGHQVLAAVGNRIKVYEVNDQGKLGQQPVQILKSNASDLAKVAFVDRSDGYQIEIRRSGDSPAEHFDLSGVKLSADHAKRLTKTVPHQRLPSKWNAKPIQTESGLRYQLLRDQKPSGVLNLVQELHGDVTSLATLQKKDQPASGAIAIGTSGRCNIYLYEAKPDADPTRAPRLLRQFRGHAGEVVSVGSSPDGRYLVSASRDSTIKIWNLGDVFQADENANRWGVAFELMEDHLVASEVRDDGPLHFRGVRGGDRLLSIQWADQDGNAAAESDPDRILERLKTLPFDTLVVFRFSRMGRPQPGFQSFAAWRPLATLMLDQDRQWAFWSPAGMYDASINGHRRFGWQINRGINSLPDFYRAAQFRETLEQPEVMQQLLSQGSLQQAMRKTLAGLAPPPGDSAIVNQIKTQPLIRVIHPKDGELVQGNRLRVSAEITIPGGGDLSQPKAFISGVSAISSREISGSRSDLSKTIWEWDFRLPRQSNLRLDVFAATQSRSVARQSVDFRRGIKPSSSRRPRLHLLAIGVGKYLDPQIQSLDFASRATHVLSNVFRQHSGPLYRVSVDTLTDRDATGSLWQEFARSTTERLAGVVAPDDLVVMYLCGHGLRDRRTNQWYFVTQDARYQDLMNDRYGDCLSLSDLATFSQLPCRKLAILDSCHSGAVQQSMQPRDLKNVLRFLQDDVVLTWTASEGDQEAAEKREDRLGRFTTHLVAALSGRADETDAGGNGDSVVTLKEAVNYVSAAVRDESLSEGQSQFPTVGPADLIEQIDLPLSGK